MYHEQPILILGHPLKFSLTTPNLVATNIVIDRDEYKYKTGNQRLGTTEKHMESTDEVH